MVTGIILCCLTALLPALLLFFPNMGEILFGDMLPYFGIMLGIGILAWAVMYLVFRRKGMAAVTAAVWLLVLLNVGRLVPAIQKINPLIGIKVIGPVVLVFLAAVTFGLSRLKEEFLNDAAKVLCLALLVQLVLDPSVIGSLGFQLSYLAMAGIFLLYPTLESWYPESSRWDPFRHIWKAAALSLSCQIFTGPLAWLRFHSIPRHFLLTNILAIPVTTGVLTSAVLALLMDALHLCPPVLIKITDSLSRLLLWILQVIAGM